MNPIHEDDIDALLRKSFDGPVPDDGFCDRVMQRVPLRRRAPAWPLAACVIAGIALCWLSLSGSALWRNAWQAWIAGHWSASLVAVLATTAALSLLALGWGLSEAEDR